MRRSLIAIALVLMLSACAGRAGAPAPTTAMATLSEDGDSIVVHVLNLAPGTRAEDIRLVAPDGTSAAARSRDVRRHMAARAYPGRPTVAIGATGGSRQGINPAFGISLPLLGWLHSGDDPHGLRSLSAYIPVPEDFPGEPADWRVEAELIDPSGAKSTKSVPVAE